MTNLIDVLVPDELGRWSSPCYQPTAPAVRRAAPRHPGPQLLRRDHLHGSHLDTMAAAARPRSWLRLASDVLAPADRVANAGVFNRLHLAVLDRLASAMTWTRASVDTMSVRAKRGRTTWAQIPSIVASLGASSTWPATAAGCP